MLRKCLRQVDLCVQVEQMSQKEVHRREGLWKDTPLASSPSPTKHNWSRVCVNERKTASPPVAGSTEENI